MEATTAEWITAGVAGFAFLGAVVAIFDNRRTARRIATFDHLDKIAALELSPVFGAMSAFLRGGIRPPHIKTRSWAGMVPATRLEETKNWWPELLKSSAREDREILAQICAYPNTVEALAAMYNAKLLDRKIVKSRLERQTEAFTTLADWWLELLTKANPDHYRDTRAMMADLQKRKKPRIYTQTPQGKAASSEG